tara:strand:+ start:1300 stop:1749 length:450 start_codon:yes stop_codon:yes gene_type:complete
MAHLMSLRGTCKRKQVGAIIVQEGRIISCGYNGAAPELPHCLEHGCDINRACNHAYHAEQNALLWAIGNQININKSVLYVTTSPCIKCAELIIQLKNVGQSMIEVVYSEEYREKEGLLLLERNGIRTIKYQDARNFYSQIQNCKHNKGS